ncbi:ATP-binding cassette domain-containing protein [Rhodovulum steppense]|nr:ATP-binding cassette domain-containing protein [Rhodovulum steppense]
MILRDQTVIFRAGERVGIYAPSGTGRTTVARVLGGIQHPDRGHVHIEGRVGWPVGSAGILHPLLTLAENVSHVAGLTGVPEGEIGAVVAWLCEGEAMLRRTVQYLSPGERALAAYAISLAVPVDHVIADDKILISDERVIARCEQLLRARLRNAGLVFISRNPAQLNRWCSRHFALIGERLMPCDDAIVGQQMRELAELATERERAYG